jgi:hypothetical protein
MSKRCKDCGIKLSIDNAYYGITKKRKVFLYSRCKKHNRIKFKINSQTAKGLISRIYSCQKFNAKKRGHESPTYSKKELYEWMIFQPKFYYLYNMWLASGCKKELRPSCDRNDSTKSYSFDNLTLMTWKENRANENKETMEGKIGSALPVRAIHKSTGEVKSFISMSEASRRLSISIGSISSCCSGNRISAGGYIWKLA